MKSLTLRFDRRSANIFKVIYSAVITPNFWQLCPLGRVASGHSCQKLKSIEPPHFFVISHCALNSGIVSINHAHIVIWSLPLRGIMSVYGYY